MTIIWVIIRWQHRAQYKSDYSPNGVQFVIFLFEGPVTVRTAQDFILSNFLNRVQCTLVPSRDVSLSFCRCIVACHLKGNMGKLLAVG